VLAAAQVQALGSAAAAAAVMIAMARRDLLQPASREETAVPHVGVAAVGAMRESEALHLTNLQEILFEVLRATGTREGGGRTVVIDIETDARLCVVTREICERETDVQSGRVLSTEEWRVAAREVAVVAARHREAETNDSVGAETIMLSVMSPFLESNLLVEEIEA
jgi:hypothetical protein